MSAMSCKLCLGDAKPLRQSHIIPEFLYKDLYDGKHRAAVLDVEGRRVGLIQKGLRDALLCDDCEQFLNETYEKPFCDEWRSGRLLPARISPGETYTVSGLDYARVKLFLLSVLFRAGVSTRDE